MKKWDKGTVLSKDMSIKAEELVTLTRAEILERLGLSIDLLTVDPDSIGTTTVMDRAAKNYRLS